MLMAGIQNLPLASDAAMPGPEPMAMKMLGVSQTIPYPGRTSLRARIASSEADAADARVSAARRELRREVVSAYYDVVAGRTLQVIVERQQELASGIIPATQARYVSGSAPQADILKARNEAAALVEERNTLLQEERAALARLDAALDQPSVTPLPTDSLTAPGATLPALDSLQSLALAANPRLLERPSDDRGSSSARRSGSQRTVAGLRHERSRRAAGSTDYASKVTKPEVKQMIERMKADQQKEITEFERKAGS